MRPEGGGGWNLFEDNDVHLKFQQAPFPELAGGGANHFWPTLLRLGDRLHQHPVQRRRVGLGDRWPELGLAHLAGRKSKVGCGLGIPDGEQNCPIAAIDMAPITPKACGEGR